MHNSCSWKLFSELSSSDFGKYEKALREREGGEGGGAKRAVKRKYWGLLKINSIIFV